MKSFLMAILHYLGNAPLFMGALKSAVSSACGLIVALPLADPLTFSLKSVGGWGHILEVLAVVVVIAEARYWKQWADAVSGGNGGGQ